MQMVLTTSSYTFTQTTQYMNWIFMIEAEDSFQDGGDTFFKYLKSCKLLLALFVIFRFPCYVACVKVSLATCTETQMCCVTRF